MLTANRIDLHIRELYGFYRKKEPVRIGIPLPAGKMFDVDHLKLQDNNGKIIALQAKSLSSWSDRSVKWVQIDFFASVPSNCEVLYTLIMSEKDFEKNGNPAGMLEKTGEHLRINTGVASFCIDPGNPLGLFSAMIAKDELLAEKGFKIKFCDKEDNLCVPFVENFFVSENGPIRLSFKWEGCFQDCFDKLFACFKTELTFFSELSMVQMDFSLHNPRRAEHPGGIWDLGDPGSIFFKDLSLQIESKNLLENIEWQERLGEELSRIEYSPWLLYQDSSGGKNWHSTNHMDHEGESTVSFPGYRVSEGLGSTEKIISRGKRAEPWMKIHSRKGSIGVSIPAFWKNFPKALRVRDNHLEIGLFPAEMQRGYELQGGEQKRHTIFLEFDHGTSHPTFQFMEKPLVVYPDPKWVEMSKAVPSFSSLQNRAQNREDPVVVDYLNYINHCIKGKNSFHCKRELIDEYGWRNFGDLYADHEAVHHEKGEPFISHYNNQFDFVFGAFYHFLGSGDLHWRELMADAARHMIDIDIYRTSLDKSAYNNGLFWHTDHHQDAATSSHRTYSIKMRGKRSRVAYGGGPSNEHNYTTGLLHYYYFTGDVEAKRTVIMLADWVLAMDDGSNSLFSLFDDGPTGLASQTVTADYHKPGRGAGNSINALMDAYQLTWKQVYIRKAEELIQRVIHPEDDILTLELDEPEYRWSYLVFLQSLGKYLDLKQEICVFDDMFYYARDSLLHYSNWMMKNEVPYREILDKVDLPTETWSAQDIRKSHVFYIAERYCHEELRKKYREKARFFFERCIRDLLSFETSFFTRPLVILTVYSGIVSYHDSKETDRHVPYKEVAYDFGRPVVFSHQRSRFKTVFLKRLNSTLRYVKYFIREKFTILYRN